MIDQQTRAALEQQQVKLLVELGADVAFANEYQETALACAKFLHHNEIVRILEQATASA
jgi:hypothetical protein